VPASPDPSATIRIDAGVGSGDVVSPFYDPLLAKIIAHGPDRDRAVACLADALRHTQIRGVRTNLRFLDAILAADAFVEGRVHTGLVEEQGLSQGPVPPIEMLIAAAAVAVLYPDTWAPEARNAREQTEWLWRRQGPWRIGWVGSEIRYVFDGKPFAVGVVPGVDSGEPWIFRTLGRELRSRVRGTGPESGGLLGVIMETELGPRKLSVNLLGPRRGVRYGRRCIELEVVSGLDPSGQRPPLPGESTHDVIPAPMPGRIVKLLVQAGDHVKASQTLLVLEAMKIEHLVSAPRDGVVETVRFREGDQVELGAELIELED
jgi:3-methylcrotonyl-CoA carboxylase alpha subunit